MSNEAEWVDTIAATEEEPSAAVVPEAAGLSAGEAAERISLWLRDYLAELLELPASEVDEGESFARFGLDSSASVAMASDLGDWLESELDPTLVYDHPNIRDLSETLAAQLPIRVRVARRPAVPLTDGEVVS